MKMAILMLEDFISDEELEVYHKKFQLASRTDSNKKFKYGICLIRSRSPSNIKIGLNMFNELYDDAKNVDIRRDALYYMAIAEAKLKNYASSVQHLKTILGLQTKNESLDRLYSEQVRQLCNEVSKRKKRDDLIGIGFMGSAAIVGIAGILKIFFTKKHTIFGLIVFQTYLSYRPHWFWCILIQKIK
jgi:fission 1 protein